MHLLLLLGKRGQLGWELRRCLAPLGKLIAVDYPEIDLTNPEAVQKMVQEMRPHVIINATAFTAVDRAESDPEIAMRVNAAAPGILAEQAKALNAAFIHYSTDYVFDGQKGSPYQETDQPNPLNVYGQSKLAGEQAVAQSDGAYLVLRTSWVYSLRRDSFVLKVLQWARQQPIIKVVTDQIGNPTWARMLAEATAQVLAGASRTCSGAAQDSIYSFLQERRGVYHLAGDGYASRLAWAQAILRCDPHAEEQITHQLLPALTQDFPTPARRPLFSALDCRRFGDTFGIRLPPWEEALQLAMDTDCSEA